MKRILDEKELITLECIADSQEPIGAWLLGERLEINGITISSATIGRILNRLEKLAFVEKESSKGRVITDKGLEAIDKARMIDHINFHKDELDKMVNTKVLEDYIMVIQARNAIERETVRLAARNITDEEIENIKEILKRQEENRIKNQSIAEEDINFHKAIARASRNTVLESIYTIISTFGQQTELFEYIRDRVKSPYRTAHKEIFEAIKKHDEEEAEQCMIHHFENLTKDVTKYWNKYYDNGCKDKNGGV
ncbi:FCD domain-containing protein [Marinisporobacter balticus]|uniref:DNA-binding FadR family transcriptional regulator n=1 Tax=Marinisporobacter balticus TaxID=2018667 RepID=A0A4R2KGN4_9FIRM|nr:FCD domain-containing protein [Marinisporobacter balticus]TCO71457.1 DNA-binding FadR family transcriptional regulator [Marinisporobacter balticus]